MSLRNIYFHGSLADQFGSEPFQLDVDTPVMMFRGLLSQFDGFREAFMKQNLFVVKKTKTNIESVSEEMLPMGFGDAMEIHLVPETVGSIAAIPLIAAAGQAAILGATLTQVLLAVGFAVVVGFVMKALAPSIDTSGGQERPEERPSFLYNGSVNITEQGYPIPLVYGIHMTGSIVVSAGVEVVELASNVAQSTTPANGGGTAQPLSPIAEAWQHAQ